MAATSVRRVALMAAVAVLLIAGADFAAGRIERESADGAAQRAQAAQRLLTTMLDQQAGARGFFQTNSTALLVPWYRGSAGFAQALSDSRRLIGADRGLRSALGAQSTRAAAWRATTDAEIREQRQTGRRPTAGQALADMTAFERFRSANATYLSALSARDATASRRVDWLATALVAGVALALGLIAVLVGRHLARRARVRADRRRELRELLEASASEAESEQLLIRHVERIAPGSAAAVLHHVETEDRLEAVLDGPALAGPLQHVRTEHLRRRSCMAVRLSRPYARAPGSEPLQECDICGQVGGELACEPLLVGGSAIGSLLVAHERAIGHEQRQEVRESVVAAAPILANQRTLEIAEWRAAADPLTGLPNRRAAEETMRRMAAHAGRTLTPLAALMVDLDRFALVNDRHGQEHGDRALAVISQVLAASVRASDFAARYGGEEFLVLLPDTDRKGATEVAEKIRYAIEHAELPVVGAVTASVGVAAVPEDAAQPDHVIRKADRALYVAKARGRNRVETAAPAEDPRLGGDSDGDGGGGGDDRRGGDLFGT